MAGAPDDLDQLIEELDTSLGSESAILRTPPDNKTITLEHTPKRSAAERSAAERSPLSVGEDLDDLLESLDTPPSAKAAGPPSKPLPNPEATKSDKGKNRVKCSELCIGGTSEVRGHSSLGETVCDTLRCTACDFSVLCVEDNVWSPKCDYLFLRNNMPNLAKLKENLVRKPGHCAFACQCSWRNADKLVSVASEDLKWVCGGHYM